MDCPDASPTKETAAGARDLAAQLVEPLRRHMATESGSAGLLLLATVVAMLWANSPWSHSYEAFRATEFAIRVGGDELTLDLHHWVNDGLMVFFFFVVGLEVKHELVMGELTDRRRAAIPLAGAAAGLVVPAMTFLALNPSGQAAQAWGVVISTDTAFLLGVLALVAPAGATQLRVFLLALVVADDVGALTVVALFYTDDLAVRPLALAVVALSAMFVLRYVKGWLGPAYFVLALAIWFAMYRSGVHPTVAGVLIALFVPVHPPRRELVEEAERWARAFRQTPSPEYAQATRRRVERAVSPGERLMRRYDPWVSYLVVPVFALANAGVKLDATTIEAALGSTLTWGIVAGLVAGKLFGIVLGSFGSVRLGLGKLPPGLDTRQLLAGAALSGIGFTISLFIIELALTDPALQNQARVGVLAASVLAASLGCLILRLGRPRHQRDLNVTSRLAPEVDPERDHIRGPADAPLTLVEYADFACPFCAHATVAVAEVRAELGDRLRYVFRHLPLSDEHPHAELAAQAVEAAGAQQRFWEMHDLLFTNADALAPVDLVRYASELNLDVNRFCADLRSGVYAQRVRDDIAAAEASGARATPTFFVNNWRHTGPHYAATLVRSLQNVEDKTAEEN